MLAPQLRGHVQPRVVEHLRMTGWHVHRISQAAYLHCEESHVLVGVWDRHEAPPAWAARLGRPSAGYGRRIERCEREQLGRTMFRDAAGRFRARLPWWRWPGPRVYSWQAPAPSLYMLEQGRP